MLFTRKAQANQRKPDTPVKEESPCPGGEAPDTTSTADKPKSPKKPGRNKRNSILDTTSTTPTAAASTSTLSLDKKRSPKASSPAVRVGAAGFDVIPDSFRVYRAQDQRGLSDSEDSHMSYSGSSCSSCSGFDDSGTGSDFG